MIWNFALYRFHIPVLVFTSNKYFISRNHVNKLQSSGRKTHAYLIDNTAYQIQAYYTQFHLHNHKEETTNNHENTILSY